MLNGTTNAHLGEFCAPEESVGRVTTVVQLCVGLATGVCSTAIGNSQFPPVSPAASSREACSP